MFLRADRLYLAVAGTPAALGRYVLLATISEMAVVPARLLFEQTVSGASKQEAYISRLTKWHALGLALVATSTTLAAGVFLIPLLYSDDYALTFAQSALLAWSSGSLALGTFYLGRVYQSSSSLAGLVGPELIGLTAVVAAMVLIRWDDIVTVVSAASALGYTLFTFSSIWQCRVSQRAGIDGIRPVQNSGPIQSSE